MFGRRKRGPAPGYVELFEAGLLAKASQDWSECLRLNALACDLFDARVAAEYDDVNPAAWNLGIAATAVGDWRTARRAWQAFGVGGIDPDGDEPIDADFGLAPIRVNPDRPSLPNAVVPTLGETEVLWSWRRSPAHAVIDSVPLPESGHRWRDVVLHDGEPKGTRRLGTTDRAVFDELAVLEESRHATWQAELTGTDDLTMRDLAELCFERGIGCDDWSGMRILCSECSHGNPDASGHTHEPTPEANHRIGMAGPHDGVRDALTEWSSRHDAAGVARLEHLW